MPINPRTGERIRLLSQGKILNDGGLFWSGIRRGTRYWSCDSCFHLVRIEEILERKHDADISVQSTFEKRRAEFADDGSVICFTCKFLGAEVGQALHRPRTKPE